MRRPARCPLAHPEADIAAQPVAANPNGSVVVIDLSESRDTTTTTFARLVVRRQELLAQGRDLRLVGLKGRTKRLYEICRLQRLLPHGDAGRS